MNDRHEITLDAAEEVFREKPTKARAAVLLTTAEIYWNTDMIRDETYADKVRIVRDWLVESGHGET